MLGVPASVSAAPQAAAGQPEVTTLRYQGWSGSVLFPELAEDLGYLAPLKLDWVGNTISGPQDIQSVVTRDVDFGGAFNGSVDKLIVAGAPIKAVLSYTGTDAESFSGVYVAQDSKIQSPRDLIGKKIGVNTLGAFNEWLVTDYLLKNGLTPDEIKRITLVAAPPVNEYQLLKAGQIDAAVLQDVVRLKALELAHCSPTTNFSVATPMRPMCCVRTLLRTIRSLHENSSTALRAPSSGHARILVTRSLRACAP